MPDFRFYDLRFYDFRHTGNTLAANAGAGPGGLMAHMGHATVRAAMSYRHATAEQQHKISTDIRSTWSDRGVRLPFGITEAELTGLVNAAD